jgi:hypothetical protein
MTIEDIFNTLSQQNMIIARESTPSLLRPTPGQSIKFPKGRKNGIARRHLQRTQTSDSKVEIPKGPFVAPTHYEIRWDRSKVDVYLRVWEAKGYFTIKPEKLQWSPYILARSELKGEEKKEEVEKGMDETAKEKATDAKETGPALPKPGDTSVALAAGSSTPNGMPYKSPLGLFDDEMADQLPVFPAQEIHQSRSGSRSRSPVGSNSKSRSRSRSRSIYKSPSVASVEGPENDNMADQGRDKMQEQVPPVEVEEIPKRSIRNRASKVAISTPKRDPSPPIEPRITRRRGGAPVSGNPRTRVVDGDKALAARLALEERNQGRNLRSRASTSGEQKQPSSALLRTTSPRKRRKVDSSPEGAIASSVDGSPSALPVAFVNGKHRQNKVNGKDTMSDDVVSIAMSFAPDEEVEERQLGGSDNDREDVKPEEMSTPLTNLTSRQSLPSDDTVFVTDAVHHPLMNGKGSRTSEVAELEGDVDIDADGDYEEDAEGEPDGDEEMEEE